MCITCTSRYVLSRFAAFAAICSQKASLFYQADTPALPQALRVPQMTV